MKQLAVLACAGWKGAGRYTSSVRLPAPFLPLGDGTTAAGRLSAQFRSLGFDVALSVGPLGYRYRDYQPRHGFWDSRMSAEEACRTMEVDPDGTPWTEELHAYARTLGTLVVQPDPGWRTKHDSYYRALETLGGYDRAVLARGDRVYNFRFLARLLEVGPWPSQFSFDVSDALFLLDREGMGIYRSEAQDYRERSRANRNWDQEMTHQPDGSSGTGRLHRAGIPHCGFHLPPWDKVDKSGLRLNVDQPRDYAEARRRILDGWCS